MEVAERAVSSLDLPASFRSFLTDVWGIQHLHPPQAEAAPSILRGDNTLVAIPTASGKSLLAYMGMIKRLSEGHAGSKAIYIVPLKALAMEKYEDLSAVAEAMGYSVGLGIGDATAEAKNIDNCNILVCTSEKLDSLLRHRAELVSDVCCVVADEFHLMNDGTRGPTLEINLTRLRHIKPDAQIIALSATVGNSPDLAEWLNANLIQSDWRPVALEYATFHDFHVEPRKIQSPGDESEHDQLSPPRDLEGLKSHPVWSVVDDGLTQEAQVLMFVGTRRSAQSEAKNLAKRVRKRLEKEDPERLVALKALAERLTGRSQSNLAEQLAACLASGVGFHHAGLTNGQRKDVEQAFKDGLLVALTATPTLAAGVNLPARRVLVRDLKRWDDGMSRPLPVMEVRQMLGRAGRPKYDTKGEAWVYCKGTDGWEVADAVSDRYFFGPIEDISSKLASEPALRMHVLASIATGGLVHKGSIEHFFSSTFLGASMPLSQLRERLNAMLDWLVEERFVRRCGPDEHYTPRWADGAVDDNEAWDDTVPNWATSAHQTQGVSWQPEGLNRTSPSKHNSAHGEPSFGFSRATALQSTGGWVQPHAEDGPDMRYEATAMGERVTQLYLDPLSASILRRGLRRAVRRRVRNDAPVTDFGFLHLAVATPDFVSLWAKSADFEVNSPTWLKANSTEDELLVEPGYAEAMLSDIKSAWMVEEWTEETTLRQLEKELDVLPGDVHHRIDLMGWLLAGAQQVLLTDDVFAEEHLPVVGQLVQDISTLQQRVRHGCKVDLLQLVNIRHVGRQRARELAAMGMREPKDVLRMPAKTRSELLSKRGWGPVLLDKIFAEIERVLKRTAASPTPATRGDDAPLAGERSEHD
ncbi:MAG: DEAD/DEAH box helicase [Candidatus Thermoplasmatota archaeon]|nr:DEAD/DEAH box helicase [Candidatus Thermoplasmatota archaeon]MEC7625678.1 DEAD/DEAH box helicase [Candidatus Thermoplasmatota archaeon]MEC8340265.1 DEAD/DEAH box helicase [Candidatus Thermoplasmatota archaeon]